MDASKRLYDTWDLFYLGMAKYVARKSKDPSSKIGAVLVRPDKTLASVGFNGFPQNMPDRPIHLNDREEKYSRIIHAEMNALLLAKEPVKGYTLYTSGWASCDRCAVHMIQAGVERFVFPELPEDKVERWGETVRRSKLYFREAFRYSVEVPQAAIDAYLIGSR